VRILLKSRKRIADVGVRAAPQQSSVFSNLLMDHRARPAGSSVATTERLDVMYFFRASSRFGPYFYGFFRASARTKRKLVTRR